MAAEGFAADPFVVPGHETDLEIPTAGRVHVETVLDVEQMGTQQHSRALVAAATSLASDPTAVLDAAALTPLYSFIKYWPCVSPAARCRMSRILSDAACSLVSGLDHAVGVSGQARVRSAVRLLAYFSVATLKVGERDASESGAAPKRKPKAKKPASSIKRKSKSRKADDADDDDTATGVAEPLSVGDAWTEARECLLDGILAIASAPSVHRLWPGGVAEQDFTDVFVRSACLIAEGSHSSRCAKSRSGAAAIIVAASGRFRGFGAAAASALVASAKASDGAVGVLSEAAKRSSELAEAVLVETGRVSGEAVRETDAARNVGSVIADVSKARPEAALACLSSVLIHLDGPSYPLRSAAVAAASACLSECFSDAAMAAANSTSDASTEEDDTEEEADAAKTNPKSDDDDDDDDDDGDGDDQEQDVAAGPRAAASVARLRARAALVVMLVDRTRDVNAFTRAAAVRALGAAIAAAATTTASPLPLDHLHEIVAALSGRLSDRSAVVRRAAASSLSTALVHNPYGASLDAAAFRAGTLSAKQWLAEHGTASDKEALKAFRGQPVAEAKADAAAPEEEQAGTEATAAPAQVEGEGEVATADQLSKARFAAYCEAAAAFCDALAACVPRASALLGSTTSGDVVEAVHLLLRLRAFAVAGSETATTQMLALVWSEDAPVREAAVGAFKELFLEGAGDGSASAAAAAATAEAEGDEGGAATGQDGAGRTAQEEAERRAAANLVALMSRCDVATAACIREILRDLVTTAQMPTGVVRRLWEVVMKGTRAQLLASDSAPLTQPPSALTAPGAVVSAEDKRAAKVASRLARTMPAARGAMALLAMVACAAEEVADSAEALGRLATVMAAPRITALAEPAAPPTPGQAGPTPGRALRLAADRARTQPRGDYRVAQFACEALSRFRSHDWAPAGRAHAASEALPRSRRGGRRVAVAGHPGSRSFEETVAARRRAAAASVQHVCAMLRGDWDGGDVHSRHFFPAARQGVRAIFALSPRPEAVCTAALREMAAVALGGTTSAVHRGQGDGASDAGTSPAGLAQLSRVSSARLARVLFVAGEVAVSTLVHAEELASALKKTRALVSDAAESAGSSAEPEAPAKAPKARTKAAKAKKQQAEAEAVCAKAREDLEAQLGCVGGSGDPDRDPDEAVARIAATGLANKGLIGALGTVAVRVVARAAGLMASDPVTAAAAESSAPLLPASDSPVASASADSPHTVSSAASAPTSSLPQPDITLVRCAVLTLGKLMAVSQPFCEANLALLFTLLERTPAPELRGTIAVALGDLSSRHPNLLEGWTDRIYARLRDSDDGVRRSTLMVLTHLILNDMVKVRGQIGEVACRLEDSDAGIRAMAQTFFTELAKRNNSPVYNLMPDILSTVATHPQVSPSKFKSIMRFLLTFIGKDKHAEALTEKLASRFASTSDATLWRGFAFCIAQLQHSTKTLSKLADAVAVMQPALGDAHVYKLIISAVAKAPKPSTPDVKRIHDELLKSLAKAHEEQAEMDGLSKGAAKAVSHKRRGTGRTALKGSRQSRGKRVDAAAASPSGEEALEASL